jgi:hypothetical protein
MIGRIGPFWAAEIRFVIESDDEAILVELDQRLGDLRNPPPAGPPDDGGDPVVFRLERTGPEWMSHPWAMWRDGEPCELTLTHDYVVPYVLWEVTRLVLESATLPVVPMHAAGLVRNGHAMALIGPSHSGKSTLAGWLAKSGWGFLTDEVSLLDTAKPRPVVHPFWRPIGVRRPGPLDEFIDEPTAATEMLVPASRLGSLADPAPLAALVCPIYTPGADGSLEPLSPAAALTTIADQLPSLGRDGAEVFHALAGVVETTPAVSMHFDDLDVAASQLASLVDDVTAEPDDSVAVAGRHT